MSTTKKDLLSDTPLEAIELFAIVSRYEHALMWGGFLKGKLGKRAEPDWHSFADTLGAEFFGKIKSSKGAKSCFASRPKSCMLDIMESQSGNRSIMLAMPQACTMPFAKFDTICFMAENLDQMLGAMCPSCEQPSLCLIKRFCIVRPCRSMRHS